MIKSLLPSLMVLVMLVTQVSAQKTATAADSLPAEKVYIHYDKDYYVAGETIWFKAYLYLQGRPSVISHHFYLQLVNGNGQLVLTQKYPVASATISGSFLLPDSLPQGNYRVQASTPAMLNKEAVYQKSITIFNTAAAKPEETAANRALQLSFYPESGNLVDGILTSVAFQAHDQWGEPLEVNGIVKTEDGTTIAGFKTFHAGIGRMQFKPVAGKKYFAEVETPAGKRSYPLPEVLSVGINLKVIDEPGGKKFQLSRSNKGKDALDIVTLVAMIHNQTIYETEVAFEDYPSVIGHIITDSVPSGILHFTVFDKTGKPLAERLSFVNNHEYRKNGEIQVDKKGINKREENAITLLFSDTMQRSLSVSVTSSSLPNFPNRENIWSRLLFTSDLKGDVYNPAWYFQSPNDSAAQAIDNLMLTHGWSRYKQQKANTGNSFIDQPLIRVSGTVVDINKKPVKGGRLNIFLEAHNNFSVPYITQVDDAGRFMLDSLLYTGKGEFFYAYSDKNGKPSQGTVVVDSDNTDSLISLSMLNSADKIKSIWVSYSKKEMDSFIEHTGEMAERVKELENVTVDVKGNKKPVDAVNEKYTSGVFRSPGKVNIDNINEPVNDKAMNGVDFVKNRIQQLVLDAAGFSNRKNFSLASGRTWSVGIFINEQPATITQLRALRADQIALVKFYEAGFVGVGSGSPGGALAVYTKDKKQDERPDDKLEFFILNGYAIVKEFYSPNYSEKKSDASKPDYRTTLYWNPAVFTGNENKSAQFSFFNNDMSSGYKITVEGFDVNGKLIHLEKTIN